MSWYYLLIAGILEIFWATSLKYTDGFRNLIPSIATIIGMIVSFYFLALAVKDIPLGTGYAIWTGIGVIGTSILGVVLFSENMSYTRAFFILLILIGIIGLKLQK